MSTYNDVVSQLPLVLTIVKNSRWKPKPCSTLESQLWAQLTQLRSQLSQMQRSAFMSTTCNLSLSSDPDHMAAYLVLVPP